LLTNFILATTIVSLVPGPSMATIVASAASKGLGRGIQSIFGAVAADAVLLVLALTGLGSLIYASAMAFTVLKWMGVLYLIYLGIKQIAGKEPISPNGSHDGSGAFVQGFGNTILNPKIIGFLIVYFPQFIKHDESTVRQLCVLGPLFLLIVFLVFLLCAMTANHIRHALSSVRGRKLFSQASGLSLVGCGVYSAMI